MSEPTFAPESVRGKPITAIPYFSAGSGKLHIYADPSGKFNDLEIEATISVPAASIE
jgi:hypothetical protein